MIQRGDLVQVVRGCGCWHGFIEFVDAIGSSGHASITCERCDAVFPSQPIAYMANYASGKMFIAPLAWLIKIDPPAEPASKRETLHLPERETA